MFILSFVLLTVMHIVIIYFMFCSKLFVLIMIFGSILNLHTVSFFLFSAGPLPLKDICRRVIRQQINKKRLGRINELNLPKALKSYLLYQD